MGMLEGARARGAFLLKSTFAAGWALRVEDRAPISVITMIRGDAWVDPRPCRSGPTERRRRGGDAGA